MSIMMLVMFMAVLGVACGVGAAGFMLGSRRLPPSSAAPQDRRLTDQTERIEQLEEELRQVKDQADFTEKLLTERGDARSGDTPEGAGPDS
jgi:hypothetical protein